MNTKEADKAGERETFLSSKKQAVQEWRGDNFSVYDSAVRFTSCQHI